MKCILSDQGTYRNSISALSIHSGPANAEFYVIGQLLQYRYCAFSAFFLSFFLCKLLVVLGFTVYEVVLVFTVGAVRKKIDEKDMPRYKNHAGGVNE